MIRYLKDSDHKYQLSMKWFTQIKSRQIRIYPNGNVVYIEQRTLTLETPN